MTTICTYCWKTKHLCYHGPPPGNGRSSQHHRFHEQFWKPDKYAAPSLGVQQGSTVDLLLHMVHFGWVKFLGWSAIFWGLSWGLSAFGSFWKFCARHFRRLVWVLFQVSVKSINEETGSMEFSWPKLQFVLNHIEYWTQRTKIWILKKNSCTGIFFCLIQKIYGGWKYIGIYVGL
jgi:hypothetical protein